MPKFMIMTAAGSGVSSINNLEYESIATPSPMGGTFLTNGAGSMEVDQTLAELKAAAGSWVEVRSIDGKAYLVNPSMIRGIVESRDKKSAEILFVSGVELLVAGTLKEILAQLVSVPVAVATPALATIPGIKVD